MRELLFCLLLWMAVSKTQGAVTAVPSLTVEVEHSLRLGCNIATATGQVIRQVRWYDPHSNLLLAYEQKSPMVISHQYPGVHLSASYKNSSYITIKEVGPDGEGCYRCVFDVYPLGSQEAMTCVTLTGRASTGGAQTAVSGHSVTISCMYNLPKKVRQVLWKKTAEQGDSATVAYYGVHGQLSVEDQFSQRFSLSRSLGETQLTISQVKTVDEACYTCEFHTYPDGTKRATSCLFVYVLPKPEVIYVTSASGETEANCTAQSRPPADITWDVGGNNRTLGPPVTSTDSQGDGTTIVTSTLLFQSSLLKNVVVKCIVQHPGLREPLSVPLNTKVSSALVILLVCGVVAVLLCLCVCFCKCIFCANEAAPGPSDVLKTQSAGADESNRAPEGSVRTVSTQSSAQPRGEASYLIKN